MTWAPDTDRCTILISRSSPPPTFFHSPARPKVYREQRFEPGDLVLCFAPKTAEVLPKDVPNKPKLMDRWSLPRIVVAKGDKGIYVVRDAAGILSDVRADSMRPYR